LQVVSINVVAGKGIGGVVTRRIVVRGRVQGVAFRWFVLRHARALGVAGTVRNRADGTVEALLQGDEPAVEALIARIREGPPASRVEAVEVEPVDDAGRFDDFEVTG
jgi:acylphosphatase